MAEDFHVIQQQYANACVDSETAHLRLEAAKLELERATLALAREKALHAPAKEAEPNT